MELDHGPIAVYSYYNASSVYCAATAHRRMIIGLGVCMLSRSDNNADQLF